MRWVLATLLLAAPASAGELPASPWSVPFGFGGVTCGASTSALFDLPSSYYGIEMVSTKRVPGTGAGVGIGKVTFASSPYGVSVSPKGNYVVDVALVLDRIKTPENGVLVAWAAKDDLSEAVRLGVLDETLRASGTVGWNKFLLVVTLEPSAEQSEQSEQAERWSGTVVMRGMSRSGLMHTLAGHGPYEKEPCSKYGFR